MTDKTRVFTNPLPDIALGDPFVLRHLGRFYMYGTNDGAPLGDGRAVPVFRSDDLITWEPLGGALVPHDPTAEHWAPEVLAWNGRFYMVVSYGDVVHRGHALWVAEAARPEGPFELRSRISGPDERFSIDGAWLLDTDGRLYLFRCVDFVEEADPPHGTGIVVQPMRDPLTPAGPPAPVLRAEAPWHLFEKQRVMPLYEGRVFPEWTTIEGPAPVRRRGRYFCGYSGGNYTGAYGTGEAMADRPLGPYRDLRGREGPLFGTTPGLIEGPGHFSVVRPDLVHDWIVLHGRSPGEDVRRVWLCPAAWQAEGVSIGPLTREPQPAPRLPEDFSTFHGGHGSLPSGWVPREGAWVPRPDGLYHAGADSGLITPERVQLAGRWVIEIHVRFPEQGPFRGGLVLDSGTTKDCIYLDQAARQVVFNGCIGQASGALPTLGDEPFDMHVFHPIMVRCRSGVLDAWVDQVRVLAGLRVGEEPRELGLLAGGNVSFDAVSVTTGFA